MLSQSGRHRARCGQGPRNLPDRGRRETSLRRPEEIALPFPFTAKKLTFIDIFIIIFQYLDNEAYDLPGSGMFQYISFRAAAIDHPLAADRHYFRPFDHRLPAPQADRRRDPRPRSGGPAPETRHPHHGRRDDPFCGAGSDASARPAGQHLHPADDRLDRMAGAAGRTWTTTSRSSATGRRG